jgi:hypothetical protein
MSLKRAVPQPFQSGAPLSPVEMEKDRMSQVPRKRAILSDKMSQAYRHYPNLWQQAGTAG